MALVENLICNIGNLKITTLKGTVNIGMTLNKNGDSSGDIIVFGEDDLNLEELENLENDEDVEISEKK